MNLVLFEPNEIGQPLARSDPRAIHVLEVLRRRAGESFDAGIVDGPLGKATIVSVGPSFLDLSFAWGAKPSALDAITVIIGLPRPQTARKILEEATALGVCALRFVATDKGDRGYGKSRLWTSGEWRRHVLAGASQAFSTRIPLVSWGDRLSAAIDALPSGACRLALDNYEAPQPLSGTTIAAPAVLCLGPERGWSAEERDRLRRGGFALAHLGPRVLRVETACVAAIVLVKARLGLM